MSLSEPDNQKVWVLIPAAGVGSRMHSATPKQYIKLHNKTVLEHTINCFLSLPKVAGILVVVSDADPYWSTLEAKLSHECQRVGIEFHSTYGGEERSGTVLKGLDYISQLNSLDSDQWVMVHDAARPCVSLKDLISLVEINESSDCNGAILACRVKDTLKLSNAIGEVISTQSRESLWQAQTPQLFKHAELQECLKLAIKGDINVTDEASAMEYCQKKVKIVEGSSDNIKLTTPSDLAIIEFLLKSKGG